jgi:SRSO17 transposase
MRSRQQGAAAVGLAADRPRADTHLLLVRRSISSGELAYYIVHTTNTQPLAELVRVAGTRWGVEETFQFAKNETGLDHYQVRCYDAWYRHITLSMLAAAFLTVTAHHERIRDQKRGSPARPKRPDPLILQRNSTTLGHSNPTGPSGPSH